MTQTLTGGLLRIVRKTNGLHGWAVITGVGLALTYIPNKDYSGPDTFTCTRATPWRYGYGHGQHHRHYGQSTRITGAALVGRWLVGVGHRIGVRRRRRFPLPARTVSRRPPRPAPGQPLRVCTHPHDRRGRSEP